MANSLLDFVMSLVRDPDAAARYAADPSGAIADADLTGVTSADVNNLIPMVTDSLDTSSLLAPAGGVDALIADPGSNVWASGAATAAFDAFGDHAPTAVIDQATAVSGDVISQPDQALQTAADVVTDAGLASETPLDDASLQFDAPVIDDVPTETVSDGQNWDTPVADEHHSVDDGPGFDIFT
jgi:hypothetical protein